MKETVRLGELDGPERSRFHDRITQSGGPTVGSVEIGVALSWLVW